MKQAQATKRVIILEQLVEKLEEKATRKQQQSSLFSVSRNQLSQNGELSISENRSLSSFSQLNLDEQSQLKRSFTKLCNNFKRSKLTSLIQSERIDFTKEDELKLLINSIKSNQKTLLEAKLVLLAFQQLDFFENKQMFQVNDFILQKAMQSIKVHQFEQYECIKYNSNFFDYYKKYIVFADFYFDLLLAKKPAFQAQTQHFLFYELTGQKLDRIYIIVKGQAAVLRTPIIKHKRQNTKTQQLIIHQTSIRVIDPSHQEIDHIVNKNIRFQGDRVLEGSDQSDHLHNHQSNDFIHHQNTATKATLKCIDSEDDEEEFLNEKKRFIEYRILQDKIKELGHLNDEVIKKNYSNSQAKKEALSNYLCKQTLIKRLFDQGEQLKQDEDIYSKISTEDQEYFLDRFPTRELTRILNVGDFICEESLIYQTKNNGEIISLGDECTAISLSKEGFESIVLSYYLKMINNWLHFLKSFKFFEPMMEKDIVNILTDIQAIYLRKNNVLYKEGDPVDNMYFVFSGELELQKNYQVQVLNQIITTYRNKLMDGFQETTTYTDVSNNQVAAKKQQSVINKLISGLQGLSLKRSNKDKTKMNKLSLMKDNFQNMRLVTLYLYTSGSFCGDNEFFEEIPTRQNRVIVTSHEAVILAIKTNVVQNILKLNHTLSIMQMETRKKNEFYLKRTIDYILLNQNFNKKKSLGNSELIEIINQRKKINSQFEEEKKQQSRQQQIEQLQQDLKSKCFQVEQDCPKPTEENTQKNFGLVSHGQQTNEQISSVTTKIGSKRESMVFKEQNMEFLDLDGIENMNKSILKNMSIIKQGDSIFDSSIPKFLREVIIQKIKQLRHLTPATVRGVISKVLTEQNKYRSSSASVQQGYKKPNKNQIPASVKVETPVSSISQLTEKQRPKTAFISPFNDQRRQITEQNQDSKNINNKKSLDRDVDTKQQLNQSRSMILPSRPKSNNNGYISQEKPQTNHQVIVSMLTKNPIKQIFQNYKQGKKNFKQIFLQSIEDKNERKESILQMKKGMKIQNIMRNKREKDFQEYMNDELEYSRIKLLKKKYDFSKQSSLVIVETPKGEEVKSTPRILNQDGGDSPSSPNRFRLVKKNSLNERIKSANLYRRVESAEVIRTEPDQQVQEQLKSSYCIQSEFQNKYQDQFLKGTPNISSYSKFHKPSLVLQNIPGNKSTLNSSSQIIGQFRNPDIIENLQKRQNQEQIVQNQESNVFIKLQEIPTTNVIQKISQMSLDILQEDSLSEEAAQLTTGRNEIGTSRIYTQFPQQTISSREGDNENRFTLNTDNDGLNNINQNDNNMMVLDFLTERPTLQTKKEQNLKNIPNIQAPPSPDYKKRSIQLLKYPNTCRKQASFISLRENKKFQQMNDQSCGPLQDDESQQLPKKNFIQTHQVLVTMREYNDQKLQQNTEKQNGDDLGKIVELLSLHKKMNTNRNTQLGFCSPPAKFKTENTANQNILSLHRNKSFALNENKQNNNSSSGYFNQHQRKLSSQTSSHQKDLRLNNLNEMVSPRTNPITYSTLSTQISTRTKTNTTTMKEVNIHIKSLERVKQKSQNIPISMSMRKQYFPSTTSQQAQQYNQ